MTSPNVPLGASVVITQGLNRTVYPLQSEGLGRVFYPQLSEAQGLLTGLVLVNPSPVSATVALRLVDGDGFAISSSEIELAANSKQTAYVRDILPGFDPSRGGLLLLESSELYGLEIVGDEGGGLLAAVEPGSLTADFEPKPSTARPELVDVSPLEGRTGDSIRIRTSNVGDDGTVFLGDRPLTARFLAPGIAIQVVDIPAIEPGFVDLRVRSADGRESDPVPILVLPDDATSLREVRGRAFYEKVDIGTDGLNLARPVMVPIRYARVDILNRQTGLLVSVADTDENGHFRAAVPGRSRLQSSCPEPAPIFRGRCRRQHQRRIRFLCGRGRRHRGDSDSCTRGIRRERRALSTFSKSLDGAVPTWMQSSRPCNCPS